MALRCCEEADSTTKLARPASGSDWGAHRPASWAGRRGRMVKPWLAERLKAQSARLAMCVRFGYLRTAPDVAEMVRRIAARNHVRRACDALEGLQ